MCINAPCKGCQDRTTGDRTTDCHTTCERYAAFLAAKATERQARADYNLAVGAEVMGRRRLQDNPPTGGNKRTNAR